MLIILAATLVLLSSFTETVSAPTYKSATDAFKDMTEFSDAEFEECKKGILMFDIISVEAFKKSFFHTIFSRALDNKIITWGRKLLKLRKPAQAFAWKVVDYTLMEMNKKGSQAQKLQKAFEKLRKNNKACENLLSSYPKLKLGKC